MAGLFQNLYLYRFDLNLEGMVSSGGEKKKLNPEVGRRLLDGLTNQGYLLFTNSYHNGIPLSILVGTNSSGDSPESCFHGVAGPLGLKYTFFGHYMQPSD